MINRQEKNTHELVISGKLNSPVLEQFHHSLLTPGPINQIILNLSKCTSIDSIGLGRLIMLKNRCHSIGKRITISHINPEIQFIIDLMKYEQLFNTQH